MKKRIVKREKTWFTSDLHFWHDNILKFCNRPYKDVEEMNRDIIYKWNLKVKPDDKVFILGDISWKGAQITQPLIERLNGYKVLIRGNHDQPGFDGFFDEVHDMLLVQFENESKVFHLSHYPLMEWWGSQKGHIHLHGHCHGSIDQLDQANYQRLDVGLDSHNMDVINIDDIEVILNKRYLGRYNTIKDSEV